ncbi:phage tail protein [Escherichia coli]|uniref:phage tail protein n=1 Tax=Escherichia coli TaxID=562 RepID=UPI003B28968A
MVQLSSATNSPSETLAATPKAVKAVMDETNKKAPLNSPALTGTPTTPTAPKGTNNTQIASTAYVMAAIAALVAGLLSFWLFGKRYWQAGSVCRFDFLRIEHPLG